jgi:hypothetical protein
VTLFISNCYGESTHVAAARHVSGSSGFLFLFVLLSCGDVFAKKNGVQI